MLSGEGNTLLVCIGFGPGWTTQCVAPGPRVADLAIARY